MVGPNLCSNAFFCDVLFCIHTGSQRDDLGGNFASNLQHSVLAALVFSLKSSKNTLDYCTDSPLDLDTPRGLRKH